jgi:hypothetical protein
MSRKAIIEKQSKRFDNKLRSLGRSVERMVDNEVAQKMIKLAYRPSLFPQSCKISSQGHQAKVSMFTGYESDSKNILQFNKRQIGSKYRYESESVTYRNEDSTQNGENFQGKTSLQISKSYKIDEIPKTVSAVGNYQTILFLSVAKDLKNEINGRTSDSDDLECLKALRQEELERELTNNRNNFLDKLEAQEDGKSNHSILIEIGNPKMVKKLKRKIKKNSIKKLYVFIFSIRGQNIPKIEIPNVPNFTNLEGDIIMRNHVLKVVVIFNSTVIEG